MHTLQSIWNKTKHSKHCLSSEQVEEFNGVFSNFTVFVQIVKLRGKNSGLHCQLMDACYYRSSSHRNVCHVMLPLPPAEAIVQHHQHQCINPPESVHHASYHYQQSCHNYHRGGNGQLYNTNTHVTSPPLLLAPAACSSHQHSIVHHVSQSHNYCGSQAAPSPPTRSKRPSHKEQQGEGGGSVDNWEVSLTQLVDLIMELL